MTTKRAAKYLNGADIGKTASFVYPPAFTSRRVEVEIASIEHRAGQTKIRVPNRSWYWVPADHEVTLHTPQSPPTSDPHGINTKKDQQAMNGDKTERILDLSTPENKANAREALPALVVGGMLGNEQASRAAGEIIADAFADVIKPSIEALQRLQARKDQ